MSRNLYMHPRNIYKDPPDYVELAIKYPNFRAVSKLELNGKVSVNLKNPEALKQLSKTLLLKDFQLDIEFPEKSLIPTIPLRLNYILWMEDLINFFNLTKVEGIDIGCGGAAIYSILAARKNYWKMIGLEADQENVDFATLNIKKNNLEELVYIFQQMNDVIFKDLFELEQNMTRKFTFCMCNPPFYEHQDNLPQNRQYRKRKAPRNEATGKFAELVCDGGEVAFVKKIICESLVYKDKILIYSSLLGHKKSVFEVLQFLRTKNVENILQTEFCQGNTTRWGVAWSFSKTLDLNLCKHLCIGKPIELNVNCT
ncbi:U6 small nuclear RNA (adenine-(43)-N(6))-methyltransferase [Condylostylus longicornis]|uniref:U6 small nuclear RNA (adenine-(43)-N(6))-methyltransferase n=1 Tax=Condylostylus longicornis TaxID=2530218 RepID=UPI00244E1CAC|nr:U6 small nuclear RNA (adenine-(43)-N(6))-methyltransferase [Condylostylus longicornis]